MATSDDSNVAVWQRLSEQWDHVGPPFRPTPEDVGFASAVLRSMPDVTRLGTLAAILLGVTPELAKVLTDTQSVEIDHALRMIAWSRAKFPRGHRARAVAGRWTSLPIQSGCIDLIFGDGCNIQLDYPNGYRNWFEELARVLRADGKAVLRVYVSPDQSERPGEVIDDLMRGRIGNSNVLRMRLFMALQASAAAGVRLSDVSAFWTSARIDKTFLTAKLGWPVAAIDVFDVFKDMKLRYSFPTSAELTAVFSEYFVELDRHIPGYEIGSRCPTIVLQRRGRFA